MTLSELQQLHFLSREIAMDEQRLLELRALAESPAAPPPDGMPQNPNIARILEQRTAALVDLAAILDEKRRRCVAERARLERFIAGVNDSLVRQILTLRFAEGLGWEAVADALGVRLTGKNASNICYRALQRLREKEAAQPLGHGP